MDADRARGALLGLAVGDALGRPVEFESPARILAQYGRVTEMLGDGSWRMPAGTVTDDTGLAVVAARSLLDCGAFDPADHASRFVEWFGSDPFTVDAVTAAALGRIRDGEPWHTAGQLVFRHRGGRTGASNGGLSRCVPYAVAYGGEPYRLAAISRTASRITHADPRCTTGAALLTATVAGYLTDVDDPVAESLARIDAPVAFYDALDPLPAPPFGPDADAGDALPNSDGVVDTLRASLAYATGAASPEQALVTAVNNGGDAHTIGALTGSVVGARFGASAIPSRWIETVDEADELGRLAEDLAARTFDSC